MTIGIASIASVLIRIISIAKRYCKIFPASVVVLLAADGSHAYGGQVAGKHGPSVAENTAVELAHFARDPQAGRGEFALAPDENHFAYVTVKPNLMTNQNEWSLFVGSLREGGKAATRVVHTISSSAYFYNFSQTAQLNIPISQIQWLSDGKTIVFKRQLDSEADASDICALDLNSGKLRTLFSASGRIKEFSISADGNTAVLYLVDPQDELRKTEILENGLSIEKGLSIVFLEPPRRQWQASIRRVVIATGFMSDFMSVKEIESYRVERTRADFPDPNLSLSPNGRHLLYVRPGIEQVLTIYDLREGGKRTAFDRPDVTFSSVTWSDDSMWFAVRGSAPRSLGNLARSIQTDVQTARDLYAVRAEDLRSVLVATERQSPATQDPYRFNTIGEVLFWREGGTELVVRAGVRALRTFNLKNGRWHGGKSAEFSMPAAPYWFGELRVGAKGVLARLENSNTPPNLYYWQPRQGARPARRLTQLNPQLRSLKLGFVEKVFWKNEYGADCFGYLVLPSDFVPNVRYPAVLMLKDWQDMFVLDGQWYSTGFPVQALANSGFVVLLAAAPSRRTAPVTGLEEMGEAFNTLAMVESAIQMLDRRNLVNLKKIGIAGFSVTSWQTQFILTHSSFPFAAASTADAWNLNYVSYAIANSGTGDWVERFYGGTPFGDTFRRWLDHAPAFNAARVRAPVLTEACGDTMFVLAPALEWFTALHQAGKPVELYLYPNGQHDLQTPRERLASLRINVDWFRYWLQDRERDAPGYDPRRYMRWRELKNGWQHSHLAAPD